MLHQCERVPLQYSLAEYSPSTNNQLPSVTLRCSDAILADKFDFTFESLRPNVFRTTFTSDNHPLPPFPSVNRVDRPKSWAPDPVPESIVQINEDRRSVTIMMGTVVAKVEWSASPVVSLSLAGAMKPIYRDLPYRSYAVDGDGVAHYSVYKKDTLHVGLGEKAAPMNLSGREFIITASDTFGYDAYRTDPLYKHIPLLINVVPGIGCVAIFSASHARSTWAVGSEIDGMWGHFKVHRQAHGGLEEYLIVGKTLAEVVRSYADLVGYPLLVPRYMMGYISGGMKYSMEDEPVRAVDTILQFLDQCKEHDIPVSAHQMSSGYTVAETEPKTRNVFTWNRHRFPDPRHYTRECHERGVRILANIKPYVLANHPAYKNLSELGAFFKDPGREGGTAVTRLWSAGGGESGEGSHLDFTSRAGYDWWYQGCRDLKKIGIDAMWNDNNEFNIPNDLWSCALETDDVHIAKNLDGRNDIGLWGRAMHTELMGKASHDACVMEEPDERPLVLTRSATAGTMRYACASWSGDNVTSWDGMKGSNALALNAGFSLLQCYGHDIGGFEGPQPTPEHLVRWIQMGVHSPRFAINCYKTSPDDNLIGEVIEPWMYPSVTPLIRDTIKRRYELIPYTYSLTLRSHFSALPPQRWTGWGYEEDKEVWTKALMAGDTQYWFGDALLIAGVFEPEKRSACVYLPFSRGTSKRTTKRAHSNTDPTPTTEFGFLNTNAPYQHLEPGTWHEIDAAWDASPIGIPVLARCGSAVPVGKDRHTTSRAETSEDFPNEEKDDWRGVEIFPPPVAVGGDATFENTWLEDDGISAVERAEAMMCSVAVVYEVRKDGIAVSAKAAQRRGCAEWKPLWLARGLDVILPVGEKRTVVESNASEKGTDARGRVVWNVAVELVEGRWE